jgi:hypothetical protein
MTKTKNKMPELARLRYSVQADVEETRLKAEKHGFVCRLLEGQPKNKRGQNGWGEGYPLNQYEIKGGELPSNVKIHIAPKVTQIFFFGSEIPKPANVYVEEFERFLDYMEPFVNDLERTEKIMNEIAVFVPNEQNRFGLSTRIYAKVPGNYRLIQGLKDTYQQIIDELMNKYWAEIETAYAEMFQGKIYFASRRLNALLGEMNFFLQNLINMAKEWNDPRAEQWETELKKSMASPLRFFSDNHGVGQGEDKKLS